MKLKFKKLFDNAHVPTRANHDDAGIDLYSHGEHKVESNQTKIINTGISLEIPHGHVGLIWDKSSIGSKGIKTLGGVIDAGYRGEIKILIHNLSKENYIFRDRQKVAQILIQKIELLELEETENLSDSLRGEKGFGSSGK